MPATPKNYQLVLLVGPPGSGKSTYCREHLDKFYRISQDDQGKKQHYNLYLKAINDDVEAIVVDRMNFNKAQRAKYLDVIPKKYHVQAVVFTVQDDILLERIKNRKDHPTLKFDKAQEVIRFYRSNFEEPNEPRIEAVTYTEGEQGVVRFIENA